MPKTEIFKIQWPQGGEMGECLIYNEDKSIMTKFPVDIVKPLAYPGIQKLYISGYIDKVTKELVVDRIVDSQNW